MVDDQEQVRRIAERLLDEQVRPEIDDEVVISGIQEFPTCWAVGYNSREFLENGSISHALVGGPVIVNRRTGTARLGVSAKPAEDQLDPE